MRPRLVDLDLTGAQPGTLRVRARDWASEDASLERLGALSGPALAAALLTERARRDTAAPTPLVISVGECVRKGLATAARASITSRAPLTGLLSEGQVGSDLARRLAAVADALVLSGRCDVAGAVLHIGEGGAFELASLPEIVGLSGARKHAVLESRFGPCASLSIGPAGERELPCACLSACSSSAVGGGPPHFVGRGGLGAVLGRIGLCAICVSAKAPPSQRSSGLTEVLLASPRLSSRSRGGTLELASAFAARGDLRERNYAEPAGDAAVLAFARDVESARSEQHGCHGCPTPCGWVFERPHGLAQGARFGASYALGFNLGLERFEDSLALLAACDDAGLDAKEIGAGLALLCAARERDGGAKAWGERDTLLAWIAQAVEGEGEGASLGRGAAYVAHSLDLEHDAHTSKGAAARPESNLAARLGQCVSARGADPMRAFPFLAADGSGRERLERVLAPLELPPGAENPLDPAGKGRIVWWHENLAAALDLTGFCAFSAGGLLSDGVCELDRLALWIAPDALSSEPGFDSAAAARLLAAGEDLVRAQRALNRAWGATEDHDRPEWARAWLDLPGMLDEYRALREHGANAFRSSNPRGEDREVLPRAADPSATRFGRVRICSSGLLAQQLGAERELRLALPAALADVLAHVRNGGSAPANLLARDGGILPAVYRAGRKLAADELVRDGDRLDLVLVVSGG